MAKPRLKVHITCKQCGERFILKGSPDGKGYLGTGFKRCLCDNERDFIVRSAPLGNV